MNTRRENFEHRRINFSNRFNAGLWFDKYIVGQEGQNEQHDNAQQTFKQRLINEVEQIRPPDIYAQFFQRWKASLQTIGARMKSLQIDGRVVVGLGAESVLETAVTLHRVYGVPYIPGSALKGLAASYARKELNHNEWRKVKADGSIGALYEAVFGSTGMSGYITFHDALYIPLEHGQQQVLHIDVMTVHHPNYYQGNDVPADWNDPTPIPYLSATGTYLLALSGVSGTETLIEKTITILSHALHDYGVGAKTSSGYGRATITDPPMSETERQARNAALQEESVGKLVNDIQTIQGSPKEVKNRLKQIATSVIRGNKTPEQKKKLAKAIYKRVTEPNERVDVDGTEWYPKIKLLAED